MWTAGNVEAGEKGLAWPGPAAPPPAQLPGTYHGAGGGLHAPIDVVAAGVPPAVVQGAAGPRPLLALQLGQDGRLALGEGWHLLQHRGLQGSVRDGSQHRSPAGVGARHRGGARGDWALTRTSVLATELRVRYSTARCWSSTSALRSWEPARSTPWMVALVSGKRLMNLM